MKRDEEQLLKDALAIVCKTLTIGEVTPVARISELLRHEISERGAEIEKAVTAALLGAEDTLTLTRTCKACAGRGRVEAWESTYAKTYTPQSKVNHNAPTASPRGGLWQQTTRVCRRCKGFGRRLIVRGK